MTSCGGRSLSFFRVPYDKGLKYLGQLFENGQALSVRRAADLYGLTWIQYQSILSAIPSNWKKQLKGKHHHKVLTILRHVIN